ncbi:helix-turn-helix transcriptional regulator [Kutzneria albida]|uniref:HTH cro/C1-type domain-containing protein n=1 Tax=Kutzneria albida DSM 43870 TaxID=1449976 RepID=W5WD24_9PSEU|nr:helix-turn-helix transcriptional regulator [Kutzneria albida]AHH99083.1 hypothetical protein KALB_5722 [Kutzneria albida DSM 43870]
MSTVERNAELADFLRTRRARLRPEDVGLVADGRIRRVPGLRREELARSAGISTEYYTRVEQGRAGNISREILDAIATALLLDEVERSHLDDLCAGGSPRRNGVSRPQQVRPGLLQLLDTLGHVPAFILGRRTDVLASNQLARALITDFSALPARKRNFAHFLFLDPAARPLFSDWERIAADTAAVLRMEAGRHRHDHRLADLIGELMLRVPEFNGWWASHHVRQRSHATKRCRHPVVGELSFDYEALQLPGEPEQTLCVYTVKPGSPTQDSLRLLASWSADGQVGLGVRGGEDIAAESVGQPSGGSASHPR